MQNDDSVTCAQPFGGAQVEFPQTFDLRVIYSIETGSALRSELSTVFASNSVPCSRIAEVPTKPGKYARMSASVTFSNLEQMRTVYAALGKIPCVKALI